MKSRAIAAISFVALLAAAGQAAASGYQFPDSSIRALGRANAGATADMGADAVWWNPAAIAGAGREAYLGGAWRNSSVSLADTGSVLIPPGRPATPVGGAARVDDPEPSFVSPTFAVAVPLGDRLAIAVSGSEPYRLHNDLPATAFTRYDTIQSRIQTSELQGTLAVRAAQGLDLGVGVVADRTRGALSYASPNLVPGAADGLQSVSGHGWDYGWTAGLRWSQGPVLVGASYRSQIKHQLDGTIALTGLVAPLNTANFSAPLALSLTTPWQASLGARFAATPQLTLHAQVDRIGWGRYDAVGLSFAGASLAIPQQYKDVTRFSAGAEYGFNDRFTLRAGLGWDPTPTPDNVREAGVPDADQLIVSGGFTATLAPRVRLDGALSYADLKRTALNHDVGFYLGTPAQTVGHVSGVVDGHQLTAGAALRVGF